MADSTALSAEEFLELSRRASECASCVGSLMAELRFSKRVRPRQSDQIASFRTLVTWLASALGDSLRGIEKYEGLLATVSGVDPFVLAGMHYPSGHAAALKLAHDVIWKIWFHEDHESMPMLWCDPTKHKESFDPARLLPDKLPRKNWESLKKTLLNDPALNGPRSKARRIVISNGSLGTRIELERSGVLALLGGQSPADEHLSAVLNWPRQSAPKGGNSTSNADCHVTLLHCASIVQRSKKSLEKKYADGDLPAPAITGGNGKPHEWKWAVIRPVLEKLFSRNLPEQFPGDRFLKR